MRWFQNKKTKFSIVAGVLTLAALVSGALVFATKKSEPIHLHWAVAHGPRYIVEAGVIEFQNELNRLAPGQFKVDFSMMTADDIKNQETNMREQIRKVRTGEIQIAQVYTANLSNFNSEFEVLDVPFLFENHKHATAFMDGEIGQRLLSSLEKNDLKGLAFTYSGGFRVIATKNKTIASVDDLKGLSIGIFCSADAQVFPATYAALNAKGVRVKKGNVLDRTSNGELDGFETVYPRLVNHREYKSIKVVNETMHSLHMTSIVMNMKFFKSLSPQLQSVIMQAANKSAQIERRVAVKEGELAKQRLIAEGVKVVTWSAHEREEMARRLSDFGNRFPDRFSFDLYNQIKKIPYTYRVAAEEN